MFIVFYCETNFKWSSFYICITPSIKSIFLEQLHYIGKLHYIEEVHIEITLSTFTNKIILFPLYMTIQKMSFHYCTRYWDRIEIIDLFFPVTLQSYKCSEGCFTFSMIFKLYIGDTEEFLFNAIISNVKWLYKLFNYFLFIK